MIKILLWILLLLCLALTPPSRSYLYAHKPGTLRVVNFFATWCGACLIELKEFEKEFANNKTVNLILINLDSDSNKGQQWLKDNFKGEYTYVADPNYKIAEHFKLASFPVTYIVDKTNKIVYEQRGFEEGTSTKQLSSQIGALK